MIRKIHVFKAGTQTSSGGVTKEFTPEILQEAASSYDPSVHEAPLVIGHAGDSDSVPAFGWVKKLEAKDGDLYADVEFSDVAEELVKNKHYKKVSISFYPDSSPVSPHPGKWNVRHLALLGAAPPAVKGLEAFKFGEVPGETLDFASELTLEKVIDEELGPSLVTEEGPLETLQEKLNEARKELSEEEGGEEAEPEPKAKTEELEENLEDQGENKSKSTKAAEKTSAATENSQQKFEEMSTKTEELQSIEEDVKDVASEETPVEMAEASTEEVEVPTEKSQTFSEGEEDEEEEMADEEGEKPKKKGGKKAMKEEEEEEPEEMAEPEAEEPQEMACSDKKKKGKGEPVEMGEAAPEAPEAPEATEGEAVDHAEAEGAVDPLEELRAELATLKAEKESLEKQFRENQVRVAKDKIRDRVSVLYGEGRLTDAVISEEDLVTFCEGLEFGTLEFAEGETAASRVLDLLARVPKMVEFGEVVSEKVTEEMKFSELSLHEKAKKLQLKDDKLEYGEALKIAYDM